jgi:hypothetical protein
MDNEQYNNLHIYLKEKQLPSTLNTQQIKITIEKTISTFYY